MTMMMLGVVPELETLRLLVLAAVLAEDCWLVFYELQL